MLGIACFIAIGLIGRRRKRSPGEPPWGEPIDRERDLGAIADAYRCRPSTSPALDDRTWSDLSLDAVFALVDRCVTATGQQTLYRRLREPSLVAAEIGDLNRRVGAFVDDARLREECRSALQPLARDGALALAPILYGKQPTLPRAVRLAPLATAAMLVSVAAAFVWPQAAIVAVACIVLCIGLRLSVHGMLREHAMALGSLGPLVGAARKLVALDGRALEPERRRLREALAPIERTRTAMSWLTLDVSGTNELADVVRTYLNVFLLLDVHAFRRSMDAVRLHGASWITLLETVGEIDAARSIASFRAGTRTTVPTFAPHGSALAVRALVHPLVRNAVPNDVALDERGGGWLVMGSNMSGKSTFLRAVGLGACLAQSIGCVTAEEYSAPLLLVRTLIHVEDDLLSGRSHFLAEAQAARDMLLEKLDGVDRLCVIDELFRGTNTADRVAAGGAFLRALRRAGAFVVAATHDAELIPLLAETFRPHYFQEKVDGGALAFDYRLREGPMAPRNALAVLELVGFPPDVLADARTRAG